MRRFSLVALHEWSIGARKLFNVRVPQYMIGFGKTVFSFRRSGTEYGFKRVIRWAIHFDDYYVPPSLLVKEHNKEGHSAFQPLRLWLRGSCGGC